MRFQIQGEPNYYVNLRFQLNHSRYASKTSRMVILIWLINVIYITSTQLVYLNGLLLKKCRLLSPASIQ